MPNTPTPTISFRKEKTMSNKWEFHALHADLIDFDKIAEDLSGANPIALVNHGETDKYVVISHWLLTKVKSLNIDHAPEVVGVSPKDKYTVYKIKGNFKDWISWAKMIKGTPWPETSRKHNTVSVSLPKLQT
jgi:hypothetical protein